MKRTLQLLIIFIASLNCAVAATGTFEAQVDRNRLSLNETLTLQLTADSDASGEPDVTPLAADFDLLNRGESTMTSIINGAMSHTRQWTLELAPKRSGQLTIPPLALGAMHSDSIAITVTETADDSADKPVFMEASTDTLTPYVQQVVDYEVRMYFQDQPPRASLTEPTVDGATVERVGEDRSEETFINGRRYAVIERHYRLIPQRSGQLLIQSPRLDTVIPAPRAARQRDPFADFDQAFGNFLQNLPSSGRRVIERAADVTLTVRAQPAGSGVNWLPATSLQLSDEWTPSPPLFRVGEPVTRTLTITATGVTAAQLPDLSMGTVDGMQIYADQAQPENLPGTTAAALKRMKIALVPTRAGTLTLPEIRLLWWNTVSDTPQVAVIPARMVEVTGAPAAVNPPAPPVVAAVPEVAAPMPKVVEKPVVAVTPQAELFSGWWQWLALLFGLLWLGTLAWWWRERRGKVTPKLPPTETTSRHKSLSQINKRIEVACLAADARAAQTALLEWALARWPQQPPRGLVELGLRWNDAESAAVLAALDRAIYAPAEMAWNGAAVWSVLSVQLARSEANPARVNDPLPPLYPLN
ncbi:BatD family protein [Chromatium okenii]|uniref:BatD family protein n=1 Tax=Chromatium okenii TaxID=61644 RepID=UPI0026EF2861|nr:BatD family protein [Chromatium okenii]MBV5309886.1 protein BatD [Chromatium okenii]